MCQSVCSSVAAGFARMVGEDRLAMLSIAYGWHGRCERRWLHLLVTAPGSAVGGGPSSVTTVSWARVRMTRGSHTPGPKLRTRCAGWCSHGLYQAVDLDTCRSPVPCCSRSSRGVAARPVSNLVSIGVPVPSGHGRLWRSGPVAGMGSTGRPGARETRSRPSCPTLTISRAVDACSSSTSPRQRPRCRAWSTKPVTFTSPSSPGFRDGRNALVRWAVLLQEVLP